MNTHHDRVERGDELERLRHRASALADELRETQESHASTRAELAHYTRELERTQDLLTQARKMEAIGSLAGGIAHDFNNLLTVILNHAETIRSSNTPGSEGHEAALRILEASTSAADITRQLLAFGRKEPRSPTSVDLNALTASMARMLERLLGERILLELDLSPEPGIVRADPAQLEQVLLNLVVNARDAMPDGGTLLIRTRDAADLPDITEPPGTFFAVSVSDTGEGIDDETRSHIFEPFFTTKRLGQGTGLGLTMVYGLVGQNDGHIRVASEPGAGTTFTAFFPLEDGPVPEPLRPANRSPVTRGTTVLLVEDEEQVREITARILERRGYQVLAAPDAATALALVRDGRKVDVLLTDVIMPGETGGQLAARLRADRPQLPVVFMSGYSFDDLDEEQLTPLDEFLQKPFSPASLCARVENALATAGTVHPSI
jgi:signal transduction histidine kinase/CheY-like chemotaxis protein